MVPPQLQQCGGHFLRHKIARGLPIEVRDPAYELPLVYIDDVVSCILDAMQEGKVQRDEEGYCRIHPVHPVTLGRLAELIEGFAQARKKAVLAVPVRHRTALRKKLYSTFLSYLPTDDQFAYDLITDWIGEALLKFCAPRNGARSV